MDPKISKSENPNTRIETDGLLNELRTLSKRRDRIDDRLLALRTIALKIDYDLEKVFSWDEREGYLSEFEGVDPRFDRDLKRLRFEHDRLRTFSRDILARINSPLLEAELQKQIDKLCENLSTLVRNLDACHDQEDVLLYKSLSIDLGGEG
jgi:hypothetical protein